MTESLKEGSAWLIVSNKEDWDIAVQYGGFGINHSPGRLQEMKTGDYYVVYLSEAGFVGWGTITQTYYISDQKVWPNKLYRHRFGISHPESPDKVLPGAAVKDDLEFVTDKEHWAVPFSSGLRKISISDFDKIKNLLSKSKTSFSSLLKNTNEIGDELHDKIVKLFVEAGFSIVESNKTKKGADIVVEDSLANGNTRILIQCKNRTKAIRAFPAVDSLIDEYARKVQKHNAVAAILVISGYKLPKTFKPAQTLRNDKVAVWTDDVIEYYKELASKISGFSKYQILGDLGIHAQFDEDKEFDAIKIQQGKYSYHVVAVEPDWLLKTTTVLRRVNYAGGIGGYQRLLNKKRITKDIPQYLSGSWIFPNAIICATKDDTVKSLSLSNGKIRLPSKYGIFWVIDGQHRLYGFTHSDARLDESSKLLLTLIDSTTLGNSVSDAEGEQANMFVNLNMHAKKVEKNLLLELHETLGIKEPSVQVVFALAKKPVFKDAIRGYSVKSGSINLNAFASDQALKQILSKYSALYGVGENAFIRVVNDLNFYFSHVSKIFETEWGSQDYILKTDRGIKGLLALYVKIFDKYNGKDLENKIVEVLKAFKETNLELRVELLRGNYLGAGGGKKFADRIAISITSKIPHFEPLVKETTIDTHRAAAGDDSATKVLKEWLSSRLSGVIRFQAMHLDLTTFDYLESIPLSKVQEIKIFFGTSPTDERKAIAKKIEEIRQAGYKVTLTRARKTSSEGGYLHHRWIGDDQHCIYIDTDMKGHALKNTTVFIKLTEWKNFPELVAFDELWEFAIKNPKGVRLHYDWNGDEGDEVHSVEI